MAFLEKLARRYYDALLRLQFDYGLSLAGAVSFSSVLALFPFLIFVTALAGLLGGAEAAEGAVTALFEGLPDEVASRLAPEVRRVLGVPRSDLLTFGIVFTLFFSAAAVESMRTALNRAYRVEDERGIVYRWTQSCLFVVVGAIIFLVVGMAFIAVPLLREVINDDFPALVPYLDVVVRARLAVGAALMAVVLMALHIWLPAGRRHLWDIWPGVLNTMALWLVAGIVYSAYLARFDYYTAVYAGLANAMIALMFFYVLAVIFLFGAELNRAFIEDRSRMQRRAAAQ